MKIKEEELNQPTPKEEGVANEFGWQKKDTKEGAYKKGRFKKKSNEKKSNGVKWTDFEVDRLIAI
jgi:hypothetical protein